MSDVSLAQKLTVHTRKTLVFGTPAFVLLAMLVTNHYTNSFTAALATGALTGAKTYLSPYLYYHTQANHTRHPTFLWWVLNRHDIPYAHMTTRQLEREVYYLKREFTYQRRHKSRIEPELQRDLSACQTELATRET